ncbi:MAG: DUF839 domain-containing protein [Bacteroidetes bacterium]|nr:DUF839 domain-containing protein [Bacteroidota bacterium]
MKKFLPILLSLAWGLSLCAQQSITVQVNTINDDLEEYLPGPNQTKTVGAIDAGSSDLELGTETAGNIDPQLVGVRFTDVNIPKNAWILSAYLQFEVDNTSKNTDPCNLWIKAQDSDNPLTFEIAPFNLSKRPTLPDSIYWSVPSGSWSTIGANGPDQRSANIARLVQALVNRDGWASGNAMAFFIQGTGLREAESYDGTATGACKLIINFVPTNSLTAQVGAAEDDLEEYLPGTNQTKTVGTLDAGSSDLELGNETAGNIDPQLVGVRFANLDIPKGAKIVNAHLQFQVDNTNKNTDPCAVWIKAQNSVSPASFTLTPFDISSRPTVPDSVYWSIPDGSWNVIGQNGADQRSTNIARLVQTLVNRPDWAAGSAMVFTLAGKGLREAESYDGLPSGACKLLIDYVPTNTLTAQVSAAEDDLEEYLPGTNQTKTVGTLDAGSSDLELGTETANNVDPQLVGVRFANLNIPKNAAITNAYLQFQVDNTTKNTDPCEVWVKAQDADNPPSFELTPFNISSRPTLKDSIFWAIPNGSWTVIGAAGADQRSNNIAPLVQALVNRPNWAPGNAMVFTLAGKGLREAESYDGLPAGACKLIVEYVSNDTPQPGNPTTNYPLNKKGSWAYLDNGTSPAADWNALTFNDAQWAFGPGPLGYNLNELNTTIGFGPNANNKYLTTYFRKRIRIADVASLPAQVEMQVRADDGVVVYVNGTEVLRRNMNAGAITNNTLANAEVSGNREYAYFTFDVPKSLFVNDVNIIAAEVHQVAPNSPDLVFDLSLNTPVGVSNPSDLGCVDPNDKHIGCFTSLIPREQRDTFEIPNASHVFQYVAFENEPYTLTSGKLPPTFDFTGYVPANGTNSRLGHLSINHEESVGAVSVLDLHFNNATGLWKVDSSGPVNFAPVGGTQRNCSGTVTPWGTVITCEETTSNTDANNDGYIDLGWNVEIDPLTRQVRSYGNGPQKLWAMGRMSHENVVVASDRKTVYQGEDEPNGSIYKFVADQQDNLSSGKLYVLKLNQPFAGFEPTGSTGTWVQVPNTTKAEQNATKTFAAANGTTFAGIEDVEINPLTGHVYFAVKGASRVYTFADNGSTVSGFETYVGGKTYRVTSGNEVVSEDWGVGNDNLTFDDRGNLWVLQDGGRNHIWIVRPNHTQADPKVEIFMQTPLSSEPTGMTFTPDYRYMFVSIQGPNPGNNTLQTDISGRSEKINRSVALAISRRDYLGPQVSVNDPAVLGQQIQVYPNPFGDQTNIAFELLEQAQVRIEIYDQLGRLVQVLAQARFDAGTQVFRFEADQAGVYYARVIVNGAAAVVKMVKQ